MEQLLVNAIRVAKKKSVRTYFEKKLNIIDFMGIHIFSKFLLYLGHILKTWLQGYNS